MFLKLNKTQNCCVVEYVNTIERKIKKFFFFLQIIDYLIQSNTLVLIKMTSIYHYPKVN